MAENGDLMDSRRQSDDVFTKCSHDLLRDNLSWGNVNLQRGENRRRERRGDKTEDGERVTLSTSVIRLFPLLLVGVTQNRSTSNRT